jgi:hypothetical protein
MTTSYTRETGCKKYDRHHSLSIGHQLSDLGRGTAILIKKMLRRRYIKSIVLSPFSHGRDLVGPVLEQDHQAILAQKNTSARP